jgi:hypothetical protein
MVQARSPVDGKDDVLALQATAERAGAALACPFSSSAEFEAAIIASRLRAGLYGPKRRWRHVTFVALIVVGGLAAVLLSL